MSVIVEGKSGFSIGGLAVVVEEDRETAWAQTHIRRSPDVKWILGNYVQAATPEAETFNSNGHSFPLKDLQESIPDLANRPLNLNHIPGRRLGAFTAAEFVWPEGETASGHPQPPIVEALACFWHYYEPELWPSIQMAHKEGALFFSMESVPEKVTCKGKGEFAGCGETFDYDGRQSPTYCSHLNEPLSRKTLHRPHFTAGALIVPPVKPGWKNADIKELSSLIEENLEAADAAYEQVASLTPHLGPKSWERITAYLLKQGA